MDYEISERRGFGIAISLFGTAICIMFVIGSIPNTTRKVTNEFIVSGVFLFIFLLLTIYAAAPALREACCTTDCCTTDCCCQRNEQVEIIQISPSNYVT